MGPCILCDEAIDSCLHIFVGCKYVDWKSLKSNLLLIADAPKNMLACWLVCQERNNRVFFPRKFKSNISLLQSIISYSSFWLENLPAKKRKTFVRSRVRGVAGRKAVSQAQQHSEVCVCWGSRCCCLRGCWKDRNWCFCSQYCLCWRSSDCCSCQSPDNWRRRSYYWWL